MALIRQLTGEGVVAVVSADGLQASMWWKGKRPEIRVEVPAMYMSVLRQRQRSLHRK